MSRNFEDMSLGSIELFCLTAELEGFTAAANAAGLTPAAVSRTIARLESRLGAQLFVRTTRKVRMTDGGRARAQWRAALTSGHGSTQPSDVLWALPHPAATGHLQGKVSRD